MRLELPGGKAIESVQGDITEEGAEAIVNAANASLLGGGGVDGAIHRAGGSRILEECRQVRKSKYPQGLPEGQAVATTGGDLAARYVIHTVGPMWTGGGRREPEVLAGCYRESLRVADELGLKSVAFPAISTGIYGYPIAEAAQVAVKTVYEELPGLKNVLLVRLVAFDRGTEQALEREMKHRVMG